MLDGLKETIFEALKAIGIVLPSALDVIEYSEVDQSVSPEERKRLRDALTLISDSPEASSDSVRLADALQLHMPEGVQERLRNDMALYGEAGLVLSRAEGERLYRAVGVDPASVEMSPGGVVGSLWGVNVIVSDLVPAGEAFVVNQNGDAFRNVNTQTAFSTYENLGMGIVNMQGVNTLQLIDEMAGFMQEHGWERTGEPSRATKAWEERWR